MSDTVRGRRRWYQFSLRTLLLFVVVGIASGWLGTWMKWKREQRQAMIRLANYGTSAPSSRVNDTRRFFAKPDVGDSDLEEVQRLLHYLPKLDYVSLDKTSVSGPGLAHLASLPKMTWLDLSRSQIDDSGLLYLKALPNIRYLARKSQCAVKGLLFPVGAKPTRQGVAPVGSTWSGGRR